MNEIFNIIINIDKQTWIKKKDLKTIQLHFSAWIFKWTLFCFKKRKWIASIENSQTHRKEVFKSTEKYKKKIISFWEKGILIPGPNFMENTILLNAIKRVQRKKICVTNFFYNEINSSCLILCHSSRKFVYKATNLLKLLRLIKRKIW